MGYFDALASGSFKTASDGSRLFFPYGALGRGYAIASEHDYQRLRQQIKIYLIVCLSLGYTLIILAYTLIIIGVIRLKYLYAGAPIVLVICVGSYVVWARALQQRLLPSTERLSVQQSWTTQAQTHSAVYLWLMEIAMLALVGVGIVGSLISNPPGHQFIGLVFIGAVGAAVFGHMLLLRRGHAGGESSTSSNR